MEFSSDPKGLEHQIINLFVSTFAAAEGLEEGALVGQLVKKLLFNTPQEDCHVFCALDGSKPLGCIAFSRMRYSRDPQTVFILSPVAVRTDQQNKGIGQALIKHGLEKLRESGVDVVMTYGDPNYYSKVGFQPISVDDAAAPFTLKYPQGWQALSLSGETLGPLQGTPHCVDALNSPELW